MTADMRESSNDFDLLRVRKLFWTKTFKDFSRSFKDIFSISQGLTAKSHCKIKGCSASHSSDCAELTDRQKSMSFWVHPQHSQICPQCFCESSPLLLQFSSNFWLCNPHKFPSILCFLCKRICRSTRPSTSVSKRLLFFLTSSSSLTSSHCQETSLKTICSYLRMTYKSNETLWLSMPTKFLPSTSHHEHS